MIRDFAGRVAVVTGAASGIGRALSDRFAAERMRVVMSDVDPARLDRAAAEVSAASGAEVEAVPADVASWEAVEALERRSVDRFGRVHVLCNNAGVTRPGAAWELTLEQWRWVVDVNLWGVIHGIKAFVPSMVERGEPAHVVNTASVGGLVSFPQLAPYSAAKAGVIGLSESLAHDLRARDVPVGVSVLCPGPVSSEFRAHSRALQPGAEEEQLPDAVGDVDWRSPADIASDVLAAIRDDRFWILTHPAYADTIERRFRGIVENGEVVEPAFL